MKLYKTKISSLLLCCFLGGLLSSCGSIDRLGNIGKPPEMAKIENPQLQPDYKPVSMPMPAPQRITQQPNSLWISSRQAFFKDQRANGVGDILTIVIVIEDKAKLDNNTDRSRSSKEDSALDKFLGYEASLNRVLPQAIDNTDLSAFDTESDYSGEASIDRKEKIEAKLAAIVTQILPNGNMVIQGRQETRVNFEKRIIEIAGIIRPEDITVENTISYEKIAEARIIYGGEGQLTDVQQPRYGQQVYDVLFPF